MDNFSEIEDLINKKVKEAINSINLAKDKYNNSEAKNILNNILSGVKNGVELASQKIENAKLEEIKKRNKIIKKDIKINFLFIIKTFINLPPKKVYESK